VGLFPERLPEIGPRAHAKDGNFFTIARLVEKKGLEYAIRALALVRSAGYAPTLTIFGDGPLLERLQQIAAGSSVATAVFFAGPIRQEEFPLRLAGMDFFVLPSVTAASGDMEGQGLALAEAQVMGFPVIATRHNGFPDTVIEDTTGYLVPERDAEALAERMIFLMNHREVAMAMGRRGRVFASEKFDQGRVTQTLIAALEGCNV